MVIATSTADEEGMIVQDVENSSEGEVTQVSIGIAAIKLEKSEIYSSIGRKDIERS